MNNMTPTTKLRIKPTAPIIPFREQTAATTPAATAPAENDNSNGGAEAMNQNAKNDKQIEAMPQLSSRHGHPSSACSRNDFAGGGATMATRTDALQPGHLTDLPAYWSATSRFTPHAGQERVAGMFIPPPISLVRANGGVH